MKTEQDLRSEAQAAAEYVWGIIPAKLDQTIKLAMFTSATLGARAALRKAYNLPEEPLP